MAYAMVAGVLFAMSNGLNSILVNQQGMKTVLLNCFGGIVTFILYNLYRKINYSSLEHNQTSSSVDSNNEFIEDDLENSTSEEAFEVQILNDESYIRVMQQ